MENKKKNPVASIILTLICILWMYPIVLILVNSLKKEVSYDTRDFTIEIIVKKYSEDIEIDKNEIFVPEYQRDFVWSQERQSKMIESIILGLPIPSIFVAEDKSGRLEIVDGSQRIRTLNAFLNGDLQLINLKKITSLNDKNYSD